MHIQQTVFGRSLTCLLSACVFGGNAMCLTEIRIQHPVKENGEAPMYALTSDVASWGTSSDSDRSFTVGAYILYFTKAQEFNVDLGMMDFNFAGTLEAPPWLEEARYSIRVDELEHPDFVTTETGEFLTESGGGM